MLYWFGNDELLFMKCIDLHALIGTLYNFYNFAQLLYTVSGAKYKHVVNKEKYDKNKHEMCLILESNHFEINLLNDFNFWHRLGIMVMTTLYWKWNEFISNVCRM